MTTTATPQPPTAPAPAADGPGTSDHRQRLLDAMAEAAGAKGYAATTIADLAAWAHVSKRTFYEHFPTKADCLIALYEAASSQALGVLRSQVDTRRDWHEQVEQALHAYFAALSFNPVLLKTLFIEILALGPVGLAARRRVYRRLSDFIEGVLARDPAQAGRPLPPTLAVGLVGAINELVLQAIEDDRAARLPELAAPAARLVRALIDGARLDDARPG